MSSIFVSHNIEVAHRLINLPGKCEQIHGHSMWVTLTLYGHINGKGILDGMDFGTVKKHFRELLDTEYDHHLLLNEKDPWAQELFLAKEEKYAHPDGGAGYVQGVGVVRAGQLPGLTVVPGDPTTENIAKWIAEWAANGFGCKAEVRIEETRTNGASHIALRSGSSWAESSG